MSQEWQKKVLREQLHLASSEGDMDAALEILEHILELEPHDKEAQSELERLKAGLRLQASKESPPPAPVTEDDLWLSSCLEQYERILKQSDLIRLQSKKNLRARQRAIDAWLSQHSAPQPSILKQLQQYRQLIIAELERRVRQSHLHTWLACIGGGLLLISLGAYYAYSNASWMHERLVAAIDARDHKQIKAQLQKPPHALSLAIRPQLRQDIQIAKDWLHERSQRLNETKKLLIELEINPALLEKLNPQNKATLKILGSQAYPLHDKDWAALRQKYRHLLNTYHALKEEQKEQLIQKITAPLQEDLSLTGRVQEDLARLQEEEKHIKQSLAIFQQEQSKYELQDAITQDLHSRIAEIHKQSLDMKSLIALHEKLMQTSNYEQYNKLMRSYYAQCYPPALRVCKLAAKLPRPEELGQAMQQHNQGKEKQILAAAAQSILNKQPSFTPEFPATIIQSGLVQQIHNSRSLYEPQHIIRAPHSGDYWIISGPMQKGEDGHHHIQLSAQDKNFTPLSSNRYKIDARTPLEHLVIDARPLIKLCKLEAGQFFNQTHLATTLSELISFKAPHCPVLAKAYLYKTLIDIAAEHPHPQIMGIPYSPRLRADARSFTKLEKSSGIKLQDNCWLKLDHAHMQASKLFEKWFRERIGTDYAAEMERNLRQLLRVHPLYIGYNRVGDTPVIRHEVKPNTPIWYMDRNHLQLTIGTMSTLNEAADLSPILIAK